MNEMLKQQLYRLLCAGSDFFRIYWILCLLPCADTQCFPFKKSARDWCELRFAYNGSDDVYLLFTDV